jgi:hypothetical protein
MEFNVHLDGMDTTGSDSSKQGTGFSEKMSDGNLYFRKCCGTVEQKLWKKRIPLDLIGIRFS